MMTLTTMLVIVAIVTAQSNPSSSKQQQQQIKSFPYIYAKIDNYNASYPVMEYVAMNDRQIHNTADIDDTNVGSDMDDRPNFLYTDTGTYRIVEFYVHWYVGCTMYDDLKISIGFFVRFLLLFYYCIFFILGVIYARILNHITYNLGNGYKT
jgi:hypothetical protein